VPPERSVLQESRAGHLEMPAKNLQFQIQLNDADEQSNEKMGGSIDDTRRGCQFNLLRFARRTIGGKGFGLSKLGVNPMPVPARNES
jgi:hypothetical protein